VLDALAGPVRPAADVVDLARQTVAALPDGGALNDEDLQLSLLVLQELAYDGIDGADERWERSAELLTARSLLEDACEQELRAQTAALTAKVAELSQRDVAAALFELTDAVEGPSLSSYVRRHATREQFCELLMQRSVYHLKEADPHTWLVPRLRGPAKAALLEVQIDEYGSGRLDTMHSEMFARTMSLVGLDDTYGAYVDRVPATVLASTTTMTMFGMQRRLRGASAGQLAAVEATSSLPSRRYAEGVRRLGLGDDAAAYFDEHVVADAVHEQVVLRDLCGGLVAAEPELLDDVLFGAAAGLVLDVHASTATLAAWERGDSSLLPDNALVPAAG
jgi:hypothetical protein